MNNVVEACEDYCSGCGLCESICPVSAIKVSEKNGFLRPVMAGDKCVACGKCVSSCPTLNKEITETKYIDFKYKLYGHSNSAELRREAASGGITTELLKYLLVNGIVDYIVTAGSYQYDRNLGYIIVKKDNIDELVKVCGSNYCPANIGGALAEIKNLPGKCAIVCLPCLARGIRLFQKKDRNLQHKIKYVISLLCNHVPSYEATDYLVGKYKISNIALIKYRGRGWFGNFRVFNCSQNGTEIFSVPFSEYFVTKFSEFFWQKACIKCNDHFGREADICMGDADFIKYRNLGENTGETMCFTNNKVILDILKQMHSGGLIDIYEDIAESELELIYSPLAMENSGTEENLKLGYKRILREERMKNVIRKIKELLM